MQFVVGDGAIQGIRDNSFLTWKFCPDDFNEFLGCSARAVQFLTMMSFAETDVVFAKRLKQPRSLW